MKTIFVAATGQHVGKTTSTLGIVANLKERGIRTGYCKPVGQKYVNVEGMIADKDAVLFSKVIGFKINPDWHSPVILGPGATSEFLENPNQFEFEPRIREASQQLESNCDLVVYEGTGHPGVGSVVNLSNAAVAKMLDAGVIMVVEGGIGRTIDKLSLSLALFREQNVPILGVIVNKVILEKKDRVEYFVGKKLKQMGIPLLGVLPYDQTLSFPIMATVCRAVSGKVLMNEAKLANPVSDIIPGSLVEIDEFEGAEKVLLVVSHNRFESTMEKIKQITKLKNMTDSPLSGIIITGDGRKDVWFALEKLKNDYVREHQIPVISTSLDTFGSVVKISRIEVKINIRTPWKVRRAIELIKDRVRIEIQYFKALVALPLPQLVAFPKEKLEVLQGIQEEFSLEDAEKIKQIERTTNHDVKAVEYFLKEQFDAYGLSAYKEFIHFALTSQDINNTATPLLLKEGIQHVIAPEFEQLILQMKGLREEWVDIPMLARTHGQPASPTRLGKELDVFINRLEVQWQSLGQIAFKAKFGGATGNFNAHQVSYPAIDWPSFADTFVEQQLGMKRSSPTTQIEHYDNLAALFQAMKRINTILIDLCRDLWTYISIDYFKQKTKKGEIGSSAMPHKVNPIDFENAEGNLGVANALFTHLADKLPISRLQRDLSDSTVLRNIGVPFGHSLIALLSIQKGLGKLLLHQEKLNADLEANWMVVAEAIQNILRRENYPNPYEALLELTRGKTSVTQATIHNFIDQLEISPALQEELKRITPFNYTGV